MPIVVEKVFGEALSLPVDARVNLVKELLTSLNLPPQAEIDDLWEEEAEQRVLEVDRGKVELVSGEKVFAKIRKKYQR